jgi:P27 family predicted phage terminase small subunit
MHGSKIDGWWLICIPSARRAWRISGSGIGTESWCCAEQARCRFFTRDRRAAAYARFVHDCCKGQLRPPPSHLGREGSQLWNATCRDFQIDAEAHLTHLSVACGALDRMSECRDVIKAEGLTLQDRHGKVFAHPLLKIEAAARQSFGQAMRALRLAPSKK